LLFASIAVIPKIDVGLDQKLALPKVFEIKKKLCKTYLRVWYFSLWLSVWCIVILAPINLPWFLGFCKSG